MLFLDLDRFKWINDSLGHLIGDQLLVAIARRLLTSVRATDTIARVEPGSVARLGGDEFVILLDGLRSEADALRVAARLQGEFGAPFEIEGRLIHATMSMV